MSAQRAQRSFGGEAATAKPSEKSVAPRIGLKELRTRCKAAFEHALHWRSLHEDAYRYAMPNRNLYTTTQPGAKKNDVVFDSTAVASTVNGAARLKQDLMPSFKKFLKLAPGPMIPENLRESMAEALDDVTDRMFAFVHASNFDTSVDETLLDLFVGTGCMIVLEGDAWQQSVFNHVPVPIIQVALEEGPWGGVSAIFRRHKLPVRNVTLQWRDAKNLPPEWEQMRKTKPDTEVELEEATYFSIADDGSAATAWHYDVIACTSKDSDNARIVERTYKVNPWITPRWYKLPGETFGRGPIIMALPDIKTLNKIVELILRNLALYVSGVYTGVDDGVLNPNTASIVPGSIIPVASNGGARGPSLLALQRSGSFDLGKIEIEDLRMTVKRFLFDHGLPPESAQPRSATEFIERVKQIARETGSPFGRLHTELIVPLVRNWLEIMKRRGLIDPRIDVDGLGIQVQVISPLAQEQNLSDVEVVVRWLTVLNALGSELVMMTAKTEELGKWIGEKLGVPNSLIRDKKERNLIMDDIKKMAANEVAKAGGTNTIPIGAGVAPQSIQTSAAAAGVAPFSRMAA